MIASFLTSIFLLLGSSVQSQSHSRIHNSDPDRAVIIVLHGRGPSASDSAGLRRDVLRWLQTGTRNITGTPLLRTDDVRLVWYSDLLVPDAQIARCAGSAGAVAQAEVTPFAAIAAFAGSLLEMAGGDSSDGSHVLRSLSGEVRYFSDPGIRCAADGRLAVALQLAAREQRPVVLVAYSFGGLVAWNHLGGRTSAGDTLRISRVDRLITIGSPVASMAVRQLLFGEPPGRPLLPPRVGSWLNIMNPDDPFAAPIYPLDSSGAPSRDAQSPRMIDVLLEDRQDNPHELRGYLRSAGTVRAIVGAWCAASRSAVAGCDALSSGS